MDEQSGSKVCVCVCVKGKCEKVHEKELNVLKCRDHRQIAFLED